MDARPTTWLADEESKPAPGSLALVQALVNTIELPAGPDRLADLADARPWMIASEILAPDADLTAADLEFVRGVREAMRALLVHNAGGPAPTDEALAPLRSVAADGSARAELGDDAIVRLIPAREVIVDRLLQLLLVIRDAQRDGSWSRLKACANDECHWAFFDRSRNHRGTWCEMAACGNRLKNREFRARKRATAG